MSAGGRFQSYRRRSGGGAIVPSATVAGVIWEAAWPARDFLQPHAWLQAQGLAPDGVPDGLGAFALDRLRWHPHCPTSAWREGGSPADVPHCPAVLVPLEVAGARPDNSGPDIGVRSRTLAGVMAYYVTPDGRRLRQFAGADGKPRLAIKSWGTQRGAGFWLTDPDAGGPDAPLVVGVGLQAVWTHVQALIACGQKVRAVACPSIHELQGGVIRTADGAIPMWDVQPDPARRPLLLDGAGRVVLLVPGDLECLDLKIQGAADDEISVTTLGPLERGWLAGLLAAAHWRGVSDQVRVVQLGPQGLRNVGDLS